MGHDFQKLLMAPDVMFMRGNIEVSDEDLLGVALRETFGEIEPHIFEEIEFVAKFLIYLSVGHVSACRDIEVVKLKVLISRNDFC